MGEMPDSLKRKLENVPNEIITKLNPKDFKSYDELERWVDSRLAEKSAELLCQNCKIRPVGIKAAARCAACYQFKRRHGVEWTPRTRPETCMVGNCPKRATYKRGGDVVIWMCAVHYQRGHRRNWNNWRCHNADCGGLPRQGEIFCTPCISEGRTAC